MKFVRAALPLDVRDVSDLPTLSLVFWGIPPDSGLSPNSKLLRNVRELPHIGGRSPVFFDHHVLIAADIL